MKNILISFKKNTKIAKGICPLIFSIFLSFNAVVFANTREVKLNYQGFKVNSKISNVVAYDIKGENYYRIRDIASILKDTNKKFDTIYENEKNEICLVTDKNYTEEDKLVIYDEVAEAIDSASKLNYNEKVVELKAYNIKGYNYYSIEEIAELMDFHISFDTNNVNIYTNKPFK